ncbi:hypothetical protein [Apilactobacillus quenuiae]|uniref:hypothetical protein n=1 Tax=Apilactobacillus quenuiae TaxID=2008377 RepID=UPI000D0208F0|nr:hypothetical protein [Apilactobacillus quenuiae]
MNELINTYIQNQTILEIYSKSRDNFEYENFILGIIICNLDEYILVKTLDNAAMIDSYILILRSDISKLAANTFYTKMFQKYININFQNNVYDPFDLEAQFQVLKNLKLNEIIGYFLDNIKVLSVCTNLDGETHRGEIITYNNPFIALNEKRYEKAFGDYTRQKNTIINLANITAVELISKENCLYEAYLKDK